MSESVSVCQCAGGAQSNGIQGGEADCPALAGRAAGPALAGRAAGPALGGRAAGRPICGSAADQQKLDIAQRHEQSSRPWPSLLGVRSALLVSRVGAHSVALVLYYFNTDQCTICIVYYTYFYLFIIIRYFDKSSLLENKPTVPLPTDYRQGTQHQWQ